MKKTSLILCFLYIASFALSADSLNSSRILNTSMVWHDERFEKVIYLTFDDGPYRHTTSNILDILKEHKVKATFFLLGERIEAEPATALRIKREGHLIADHTYSHKNLTLLSREDLKKELQSSRDMFLKYFNYYPVYFRPPSGVIDHRALRELAPYRSKIIMWDIDPQDWNEKTADDIYNEVIRHTEAGSIIVLHDNVRVTAEALPRIIKHFQSLGFEFKTVDNIFKSKTKMLIPSNPVYRLVKERPVRLFDQVSSSN